MYLTLPCLTLFALFCHFSTFFYLFMSLFGTFCPFYVIFYHLSAPCRPLFSLLFLLKPSEDVVISPKLVAHLLSSVMIIRVALSAQAYLVPKDPFSDPGGLSRAVSFYQESKGMEVTGVVTSKQLPILLMDGILHKQEKSSIIKSRVRLRGKRRGKEGKKIRNMCIIRVLYDVVY